MRKHLIAFTLLILAVLMPTYVFADTNAVRYTNTETNYRVYIVDLADLISSSDEESLVEDMMPLTAHGHVIFISLSENPYSSANTYAKNFCLDTFGRQSASVFIIDMDTRYIRIYNQEDISYTLTDDYCETITDNVYTYASDEEYYTCASKAFKQMTDVVEGKRIAQPMKYICNAFFAVAIALLINYFIVMAFSRSRKPSTKQVIGGIYSKVDIYNARADFVNQTKRYSPQSSSSSGGSGRSGGGGGGGGHSSGGGHRF